MTHTPVLTVVDIVREALIHGPPYAESDDTTALAALDALVADIVRWKLKSIEITRLREALEMIDLRLTTLEGDNVTRSIAAASHAREIARAALGEQHYLQGDFVRRDGTHSDRYGPHEGEFMEQMTTYVIDATAKVARIHCIPNAPTIGGGTAITLCGWVDVTYSEEEEIPDCPDCLAIVTYCKELS